MKLDSTILKCRNVTVEGIKFGRNVTVEGIKFDGEFASPEVRLIKLLHRKYSRH